MRQANASCAAVPQFDRLRYFYGQMLHSRDLQSEQGYFREKLKLHNRCLHGWGVVCGLEVAPAPPDPDCIPITDTEYGKVKAEFDKKQAELKQISDQSSEARVKLRAELEELRRKLSSMGVPTSCLPKDERTKVQIACGLAIDCEGNEIVLRQPMLVDLWSALSADDRKQLEGGATKNLYLAICYRECPIDPVRPVVPDSCGATSDCEYSRLRDSFSIVVTTDAERWKDERCEPCCEECKECCVLLARIDDFVKGQPLAPTQIHMDVHREISLRPTTRISGINWVHDGTYTPQQAATLLGTGSTTGGIEIRFTRPVWTETITDGTVDVWVVEGGRGRSASISNKSGTLVLPATPTTDRVIYRDDTSETLNYGDRVLITLRSAFLLDNCCRPVDGAHRGGRVPLLPGSPEALVTPTRTVCPVPPGGIGPWTSGAGGAANFESWFWIDKP
ncbi:MAG TPA: hypothetical protein VIX73_19205 [Kofleriaceae bacterium]|jgi:hypothetical protein